MSAGAPASKCLLRSSRVREWIPWATAAKKDASSADPVAAVRAPAQSWEGEGEEEEEGEGAGKEEEEEEMTEEVTMARVAPRKTVAKNMLLLSP